MFIKIGDTSPITVIEPVDIDTKNTAKSLKKAIKSVKDKSKHAIEICQAPSEQK
jgi:hypothetical protein